MDRIVFLKGDIIVNKNDNLHIKQTIVCIETTCSNSSKKFKGVDVNTGDVLELDFFNYVKLDSEKLYTKKETDLMILNAKFNIYDRWEFVRGSLTDVKRWKDEIMKQIYNIKN